MPNNNGNYGDKASGLRILEQHFSSPVRKKNLTIQSVTTYYIRKGEDFSILPTPSVEKPLIFRSSFLGENQAGNSGRAKSIVVTDSTKVNVTIDEIIQSYPENGQSQSLVIQPYMKPIHESSGVITFDTDIMRIDSLYGEGCEAIVSGTKPTELTLYDGKNLISNAHFDEEILGDLYSEMQKLAKEQGTSFVIEYVMDEDSKTLDVLQFKPIYPLEEKPSYIDPEYLPILERKSQRLDGVQTIVPGNNAVFETEQIFCFQNMEAAHHFCFMDEQVKHGLYIIRDMTTHSMGSHYATNFQAAGITVMYAPPSSLNILKTPTQEKKKLLCSPQQQELFFLSDKSSIDKKYILSEKLRYLIPEKDNLRTKIKIPDNLLGRSIAHTLNLKKQKELHILQQMEHYLNEQKQSIWHNGFEKNEAFHSLLLNLNQYNLLPTFFLLFGNKLEESDIQKITDDMQEEVAHLQTLNTSEGLFQEYKTIDELEKDYIKFENICNQLNKFLLNPSHFNTKYLKFDKHNNDACQQIKQYIYTLVLFQSYIEYMDRALKRLASNSQRNHPAVYTIFCKTLQKFSEPYYTINNTSEINWRGFNTLEKTIYDGIQSLTEVKGDDTTINKQYEYSEPKLPLAQFKLTDPSEEDKIQVIEEKKILFIEKDEQLEIGCLNNEKYQQIIIKDPSDKTIENMRFYLRQAYKDGAIVEEKKFLDEINQRLISLGINPHPRTTAEFWTKQHSFYNDLFHSAIKSFISDQVLQNLELTRITYKETHKDDPFLPLTSKLFKEAGAQEIMNFPQIIRDRLEKIPPSFFSQAQRFKFDKTDSDVTLEDKLLFIFNYIYSVEVHGDCIFLTILIPITNHNNYMMLPLPITNAINATDLSIYFHAEGFPFHKSEHEFAEKNKEWCHLSEGRSFIDIKGKIIADVLEKIKALRQPSPEKTQSIRAQESKIQSTEHETQEIITEPEEAKLPKMQEPYIQSFEAKKLKVENDFLKNIKLLQKIKPEGPSIFNTLKNAQEKLFLELNVDANKEQVLIALAQFLQTCNANVEQANALMGHGWLYRTVEIMVKAVIGALVGIGMILGVFIGQGLANTEHREKYQSAFFTLNQSEESTTIKRVRKEMEMLEIGVKDIINTPGNP